MIYICFYILASKNLLLSFWWYVSWDIHLTFLLIDRYKRQVQPFNFFVIYHKVRTQEYNSTVHISGDRALSNMPSTCGDMVDMTGNYKLLSKLLYYICCCFNIIAVQILLIYKKAILYSYLAIRHHGRHFQYRQCWNTE